MNRKVLKIIKGIIFILVILIIFATIIKLKYKDEILLGLSDVEIIYVGEQQVYEYNIDYVSRYKDNIIEEEIKSVTYNIAIGDEAIYGSFYIGVDNKLYIVANNINKSYIISDKKFISLYENNNETINGINLYAIDEDGQLYFIQLASTDIFDVSIVKLDIPYPVTKFTNLNIEKYSGIEELGMVVLCNNNKMYHAHTSSQFNEKTLNVFDKYIIYENNEVSDIYGRLFFDVSNVGIRIKTILIANEGIKDLERSPNVILITDEDKIVYLVDSKTLYKLKLSVKNIEQIENEIMITFENDEKVVFEGAFDENYFPI